MHDFITAFRAFDAAKALAIGTGCVAWAYAVGTLGNQVYPGDYEMMFNLRGCVRDRHTGGGGYDYVLSHRCCF